MNYTKIIEGVITVLAALCTTIFIPYIKTKIDEQKFKKLLQYTRVAVQAAEMLFQGTGLGAQKKAYVIAYLNEKGIKFDADTIENAIESAVLELKHSLTE